MSRIASKDQTGSFLFVAIGSGLFAGIALLFTLITLGLPRLEAAVFAALSGFTLGAFVYRERDLTSANKRMREEHSSELESLEKRIQYYYDRALVCLAYFDAGTLLVEKVSPGFLQLLRIPPDLKVRGKSIVELLHVSASRIEAIVSEAQRESTGAKTHQLLAADSRGSQFTVEVTFNYIKQNHMVEAAFFVSPFCGDENVEQVDMARKDLERFRRGMYRRETRILELKEEVNEILKAAGREPRYSFDQKTQETPPHFEKFSNNEEGL